jgi:DNA-binding FrmR family transcriptional regulator
MESRPVQQDRTPAGVSRGRWKRRFYMGCCNHGEEVQEKIEGQPERHKHRNLTEERDLLKRLNRIEGQVRGVKAMVEDERYCVDILNQVSAVQAALNSFARVLLSNHIKTCVVDDIEAGNGEAAVDELCRTIQKLLK